MRWREAMHPVVMQRVALLGPALVLVSLWIGTRGGPGEPPVWRRVTLPWFILGFLALVAVNSTVAVPDVIAAAMLTASNALLLFPVTAPPPRSRNISSRRCSQAAVAAGWSHSRAPNMARARP